MDLNYNARKQRVRKHGTVTLGTNIPVDLDERIADWQRLLRDNFDRCATKSDLIEMSLDALDLLVFLGIHFDKPVVDTKQLGDALERTIRDGHKLRIRFRVQSERASAMIEAAE